MNNSTLKRFVFGTLTILLAISFSLQAQEKNIGFNPYQYTIEKKASGKNGAVSSAHPLASSAGLEILKKGGNAFDAAIATQLALAVVYPNAGNIGGGGFLVGFTKDKQSIAIDYREKAPMAATKDMYLDSAGNPMLNKSQNGHLASGVPGSVAGFFATHKYGKLDFKEIIQPAIELAEKGFVITKAEAQSFNSARVSFIKYNTVMPVFVSKPTWKEGDTLIQLELAKTLKLIRDHGMKGFYEGENAKLIVDEMKRGNGLITEEDLKNYKAAERRAIEFDYKGHVVIGMPMPSS